MVRGSCRLHASLSLGAAGMGAQGGGARGGTPADTPGRSDTTLVAVYLIAVANSGECGFKDPSNGLVTADGAKKQGSPDG